MVCRIWLASHYARGGGSGSVEGSGASADDAQTNEVAVLAARLWTHFGCVLPPTFAAELSSLLGHTDAVVRAAAAAAISAALDEAQYRHLTPATLDALCAAYEAAPDRVVDDGFRRDSRTIVSQWEARAGAMMALGAAAGAAASGATSV